MHLQPDQFSRCCRTDKGVSALGNAFSCRMRVSKEGEPPLDYCKMINMALPNTIRVIGWAYVDDTFDARFSCTQRTYRYFMHLGGLNLAKMNEALAMLVGSHDFRNFCKMDVINVGTFVRNILSAKIVPLCNVQFFDNAGTDSQKEQGVSSSSEQKANDMSLGYLEIVGNAFLYHQIRCTVTVLVLIGKGLEEPSVIKDLLNVEKYPSKPCYPLADDSPLVLWDCEFSSLTYDMRTRSAGSVAAVNASTTSEVDGEVVDVAALAVGKPLQWNLSEEARWVIEQELRDITTSMLIRSATAVSMHQQIRHWAMDTTVPPCCPVTGVDWTNGKAPVGATKRQAMGCSWEEAFIGGGSTKNNSYRPLMSRPMEKTYEQKVNSLSGHKRERQETNMSKRTQSSSNAMPTETVTNN
jgi:tRNA pseudouridine38/39 synthase